MKFVLVCLLLLLLTEGVVDKKIQKCLVECSRQKKAINVCIAECTKNAHVVNGALKAGPTTKKPVTSAPQHHEDSDVERELQFLHEKEREDDSETSKLEKELLEEEKRMKEDRKHSEDDAKEFLTEERAPKKDAAKIKKAHDALMRDQKEMMEEMRKLREERQRLIEVERNAAMLKEEEGELEHPGADIRKFACLKACLNNLHNAVLCKQRCEYQAKMHIATTKGKPIETHAPGQKCKGTCYGAQKTKNQCCDTCEDVQAAYMARNWAIPTLDHFVQCKGVKKAVMSHTQMIGGRNRLFRHTWSQNQRNTNKAIHNIMFKHLERHTVAKPHFVPKVAQKVPLTSTSLNEKIMNNIKKWEEYRLKKKANFVPGMMLKMSEANRRRWAMLKVHHWMQPHKATILKAQGVAKYVAQKKQLQGSMAKKIANAAHSVDKVKVIQKAKAEMKKFVKTGAAAKKGVPAPKH